MKTQNEIEDRIRYLLVLEIDRRVLEANQRLPHRCTHNHHQSLDTRQQVDGEPNETFNRVTDRQNLPVLQTIGLCMVGAEHPDAWQGTICEDPVDAQRCPLFTPMQTKKEIETSFWQDVSDSVWVQEHLPEMYGLFWALQRSPGEIRLPWWKRFWYRFLRIQVEPVHNIPPLLPATFDDE